MESNTKRGAYGDRIRSLPHTTSKPRMRLEVINAIIEKILCTSKNMDVIRPCLQVAQEITNLKWKDRVLLRKNFVLTKNQWEARYLSATRCLRHMDWLLESASCGAVPQSHRDLIWEAREEVRRAFEFWYQTVPVSKAVRGED